jgi:ribosome biogenesis GTPase
MRAFGVRVDKSFRWLRYNVKAKAKGKLRLTYNHLSNPIAVGDTVGLVYDEKSEVYLINEIYTRSNYLIRKSNNLSRQSQIIASNIDYVLVFFTLSMPRTSNGFVDRILATSEAYSITPIIIFNKIDLYENDEQLSLEYQNQKKIYTDLDYLVFSLSLIHNDIPDELKELISNKKVLITGHSGTGKSSFLKKLDPDNTVKIGEISNYSQKGKHTTTFAEMHIIGNQYFIIDTPGIKDFGLVEMRQVEIADYFPEMLKAKSGCKFSNCKHIDEPNCKVIENVHNGIINLNRYYSYLSMMDNSESHK